MPPVRTPSPPAGGKGKGLNAKSIGGLPLWAVVGIGAVGSFVLYRFYKNYQAGASATPTSTAAPATTDPGTSGSAGGSPTDTSGASGGTTDLTPVEDLANALNGYSAILGAGGGFGGVSVAPSPFGSDVAAPSAAAQAPTAPPAPALQTSTLHSGATLTFHPQTGIVTEQAPGGSAYRVASGVTSLSSYLSKVTPQEVPAAPQQAATHITPAAPAPKPAPKVTPSNIEYHRARVKGAAPR